MAAAPLPSNRSLNGVAVTFSGLTYTVPNRAKKGEKLALLQDIDGHFMPGRLTALMGPSGSGKSTLMDILAGRKSGAGKIEGEILYGGAAVGRSALRNLCGYVEQFDTLVGELTVEQMLMYTAELKLPRSTGRAAKKKRVDEVIGKLKLEKCRHTVIGSQLVRGISGGQAKRVNIALALITRPCACFLDEPTSGLDSRMANEVCVIMKALAEDGCTVIATIHSPTSFAFGQFDDLYMLQGGGRPIYSGPVPGIKAHFANLGHVFPEQKGYSLPDWLVDITSAATGAIVDGEDTPAAAPTDFAAGWKSSEACALDRKNHAAALSALKASPADWASVQTKGPGQLYALKTLLAYRMTTHYRSGEYLGPRFGDKIFMGLLAMSLYWGIGDKVDAQSIQSTSAVLFFFCALCGFGAAAYVPSLTLERPLFYRERADGCYVSVTYYMSKFIEEAVLCVFTTLTFTVVVFFAMKLQGSFFLFAAIYFLTAMTGIALAYFVAAVAPNMDAANALLPTYVTTCLYFGGLLIVFDKIPMGWKWYSWSCFMRYAWGAMMLNQYKDHDIGAAQVFFTDGGRQVGVLEFYGMAEDSKGSFIMHDIGACIGILAALCVFFGCLGVLAVTFVSHVKR